MVPGLVQNYTAFMILCQRLGKGCTAPSIYLEGCTCTPLDTGLLKTTTKCTSPCKRFTCGNREVWWKWANFSNKSQWSLWSIIKRRKGSVIGELLNTNTVIGHETLMKGRLATEKSVCYLTTGVSCLHNWAKRHLICKLLDHYFDMDYNMLYLY